MLTQFFSSFDSISHEPRLLWREGEAPDTASLEHIAQAGEYIQRGGAQDAASESEAGASEAEVQPPSGQVEGEAGAVSTEVLPPVAETEAETQEEAVEHRAVGPTKKALEKTRERLETQVFQNSESEDQEIVDARTKKYEKTIRESLENLENFDRLRKFIESHTAYGANYLAWNSEFCEMLELKGEDEKSPPNPVEQRRYVAALQLVLADVFSKQESKDIFDAKRVRKNPFTYIDGRMGAYTVSVLAAYWNGKYSESKKVTLKFAGLDQKFGEKGDNQKMFNDAIAFLEGQLKGVSQTVAGGPTSASESSPDLELYPLPSPTPELDPIQLRQAETLTQAVAPTAAIADRLNFNFEEQKKDFEWLRDEKGKDIHAWFWKNSFDIDKDSWPAKSYRDYERLYDEDKDAGRPLRKETLAAWDRLWQSINDYRDQARLAHERLEKTYRLKVKRLVYSYDLPTGVDWTNLNPVEVVESVDGPSTTIKSHLYRTQEEKILPAELRERDKLSDFFRRYFNSAPNRILKDWAELENTVKSPTEIEQYFSGLDRPTILKRVEAMIHLNNMYRAHDEVEKLKADYGRERASYMASLNGNYEQFYQNFKGNPKADFVTHLFEGPEETSEGPVVAKAE